MTLIHLQLPCPSLKSLCQLLLVLGLMLFVPSCGLGNHHIQVELGYMRNRDADAKNVSGMQSKTSTSPAFLVSVY